MHKYLRINPAPSYGVLNPAGRLFYAIHPSLFYSARVHPALLEKCGVHPRSRAAGYSGRCWIEANEPNGNNYNFTGSGLQTFERNELPDIDPKDIDISFSQTQCVRDARS